MTPPKKPKQEDRAKEKAKAKEAAQAEKKARADEKAKARKSARAEKRARAEEMARAKAQAKEAAEAEKRARAEAEAQAKAQAKRAAQAEKRARAEEEIKAKEAAEAEKRSRAEEKARDKAQAREAAVAEKRARAEEEVKAKEAAKAAKKARVKEKAKAKEAAKAAKKARVEEKLKAKEAAKARAKRPKEAVAEAKAEKKEKPKEAARNAKKTRAEEKAKAKEATLAAKKARAEEKAKAKEAARAAKKARAEEIARSKAEAKEAARAEKKARAEEKLKAKKEATEARAKLSKKAVAKAKAEKKAKAAPRRAKKPARGVPRFPILQIGGGKEGKRIISLSLEGTELRLVTFYRNSIESWERVPLKHQFLQMGQVADPEGLSQVIKSALEGKGVKSSHVVCAIPGMRAVSRVISVPNMSNKEMESALPREIRRVMTVSEEDNYIHWQALPAGKEQTPVFVLIVPREGVLQFLEALRLSGVKPHALELKPLALVRAVNQKDAIIASGESNCVELVIVVDDIPIMIRSTLIGEEEVSEDYAVGRISDEIRRTIVTYDETNKETPLDPDIPIYLCGATASSVPFALNVAALTGRTVQPLEPPIHYPKDFPLSDFMVNVGLILRIL